MVCRGARGLWGHAAKEVFSSKVVFNEEDDEKKMGGDKYFFFLCCFSYNSYRILLLNIDPFQEIDLITATTTTATGGTAAVHFDNNKDD